MILAFSSLMLKIKTTIAHSAHLFCRLNGYMWRHLSQLTSQIIWPHWVKWGLIWKAGHSSRSLWNTPGAVVSGCAGSMEGEGHLKQLVWVRGRGMESANWKWAPHAEGNHRVNRNQKDRANPVGTRQELITRGNYCLDHSLWHRILKHQQMCLECSGTEAGPNLLLQSIHDFETGKAGIDKDWATSPDHAVNLILQSTWDVWVRGMAFVSYYSQKSNSKLLTFPFEKQKLRKICNSYSGTLIYPQRLIWNSFYIFQITHLP